MSEVRPSQDARKVLKRWNLKLTDDQILTVHLSPANSSARGEGDVDEKDPWVSDLDNSGDPEVHDLDPSSDA